MTTDHVFTNINHKMANKLQNYFSAIEQLLIYKEYNQLTKRLIDLTLDTENIKYYKIMLDNLDWLDNNKDLKAEEIDDRYKTLFILLKDALTIKDRQLDDQENRLLIRTRDLCKSYNSHFFTLGPINLRLHENQIIGLVGENGNGKTTLLRLLAGELSVSAGIIDYNFTYTDRYNLRSQLVYIPQRTPIWQGSLLTNLEFTAASYGTKNVENQMKVQLVVARMGIRAYRNLPWASLSSGYKMRFELARALLRNPQVLLIDEPLANLDIIAQKNVLDDLKEICSSPFRPMGIILSSQQLYEVEKNATDVLFLKKGKQKNLFDNSLDFDAPDSPAINEDSNQQNNLTEEPYMIEFETPWSMAQVRACLEGFDFINIKLNGGTYILYLHHNAGYEIFLNHALKINMPLTYFRDISKSTRRFFVS